MPEEYVSPSSAGNERGRNAGHETGKDGHETDGETERTGEDQGKKSRQADQRTKQDQGNAKRLKEEIAANKKDSKLSWKDTKKLKDDIRQVQDEQSVEFDASKLEFYRKKLSEHTNLSSGFISKMTPSELMVAAQALIGEVGHEEPPKISGKANEAEGKRRQQKLDLQEITEVTRGEELTPAKVEGLIRQVEQVTDTQEFQLVDEEEAVAAERRIVFTEKPLSELTHDEVVEELTKAKIDIEIPHNWGNRKQGPRENVLAEARIINEVEPEIEEVEIAGKKYLVWQKDKETRQVYGLGNDLSKDEAQMLLNRLGIKEKVPWDWRKHGNDERKLWLADRGLEPLIVKIESRDLTVADFDLYHLTRRQTKKIFGFEPPANWAALNYRERSKIFLANKIIPTLGGAGIHHTEWNDRRDPTLPIGPANLAIDNPMANSNVDLSSVINRRLQLINEGHVAAGPGEDWTELGDRMAEEIARLTDPNFKRYGEISVHYETILKIQRGLATISDPVLRATLLADFDQAILPAVRAQLQTKIDSMNTDLRAIQVGMAADELKEFFDDIKDKSNDLLNSVEAGWYSEETLRSELLKKAMESPLNNLRGREGIREWYVMEYELPNVVDILNEFRELKSVTDPMELEKVVRRGLLKAENTSLGSQDLNAYYQRIIGLLQNYPRFKSTEFSETATRLYGEINASLLRNQLYLASQGEEGGQEALLPIYKQIQDIQAEKVINTNQLYLGRFSMKYTNGQGIEGDDKLPIIDPTTGLPYEFNIQSDGFNVHWWYEREERIMLNEIQNAQKENRALNPTIFTSRGYVVPSALDKNTINEWFKHNTLIGASTEIVTSATGTRSPGKVTYFELQINKIESRIKKLLREKRGLSQDQIRRMEFLIRGVNLNAYRWTRSEGGSEYDGIDTYWDKNGVLKDKPQDDIFSFRTPYYERAVDNTFKHFRNEKRGIPDKTNQIFEESLPLGYMLPTVRKLVRYTENIFMGDDSPEVLDIASINIRHGLALAPGTTVKQAVEAITTLVKDKFDTTKIHATGVAIADLIDNGNIVFGRIDDVDKMVDWEERVSDMGRFDYVDLHSDRGGALKMYTEGLQEYLKRPSFENLVNMLGPLSYSKRPLRIWPNNRKAIEAHHKIEQKAKKWGTAKRRGAAAETAYVIEEAVSSGRLDPEDEETMK